MKKLLYFLTALLFASQVEAQYLNVNINFKDNTNTSLGYQVPILIRNTDSSTFTSNPYSSTGVVQGNGYYQDSLLIDPNYSGHKLHIEYYACGNWVSYDTAYSSANQSLDLNFVIYCSSPCDAGFQSSGTIWDPKRFNFTSDYNNFYRSHSWDFGDGTTSTATNPLHIYQTAGTKIIEHTIVDSFGSCTATAYDTIVIDTSCKANFSFTSVVGTGIETVAYVDSSNRNPNFSFSSTMHWGDGTSSAFIDTTVHTYQYPDSFTLTYVIQNGSCTDSISKTIRVGVDCKTPIVTLQKSSGNYNGEYIIRIDKNSQMAFTNYYMSFNNGPKTAVTAMLVEANRPDSFPVKVWYEGAQSPCEDSVVLMKHFVFDTTCSVTNFVAIKDPKPNTGRVQFNFSVAGRNPNQRFLSLGNGDTISYQSEYWYRDTGVFQITFFVKNDYNYIDTQSTYVHITDTTHCVAWLSKSSTTDPGIYKYNAAGGYFDTRTIVGNQYHFDYTFTDTAGTLSGYQVTKVYKDTGTFIAALHVYDTYGLCSDYDYDTVHITTASSCNANFTINQISQTQRQFVADYALGSSSQYVWNLGDGNTRYGRTLNYTYQNAGTYTVTLTINTTYCSTTSSQTTYIYIPGFCNSHFSATYVAPFTVKFKRDTISADYPTFKWRFGDGDSTIGDSVVHTYASQAGTYLARSYALDSTGFMQCSSSQYIQFNGCGLQPSYGGQAIGYISFDDTVRTDYDSIRIYLIGYDSTLGTLTAIDSVQLNSQIDSGTYYFDLSSCYSSDFFFIKGVNLGGSKYYSNFLPTYANQSTQWNMADSIFKGQFNNVPLNFMRGTNPGGPGFIGGYISQGANKNGAGLDGIQVNLYTDQNVPVTFTYSFNSGRYEFHNLAYGKYKIQVEIPGKPSIVLSVTLDANNESQDDFDFEVNSTYVGAPNSIRRINPAAFKLYPNPGNGILTLETINDMEINSIEVYDIRGRKQSIKTEQFEKGYILETESLESGVYFILINSREGLAQLKYIRQ